MTFLALCKIYGTHSCVLLLSPLISLAACGEKTPKYKSGSSEPLTLADVDYSDMDNWLSFGGDGSREVDIFVVYHPTLCF